MHFFVGYPKIKTPQHAPYPFASYCAHACIVVLHSAKISCMQNVLNNGEEHIVDIAMMVRH